eukprot:4134818-Amphidinium_carterae.1
MDRLAEGKANMNVGEFEELQTKLGWSLVSGSIMVNPKLAGILCIPEQVTYDWMHILFVSGVFNHHVGQMLLALKKHNIGYAQLHTYLGNWTWPAQFGSKSGQDTCNAKQASAYWKKQMFSPSASECRAVCPVLANYVQQVLLAEGTSTEVRAIAENFL